MGAYDMTLGAFHEPGFQEYGKIQFGCFPAFMVNMYGDQDVIDAIVDTNDALEKFNKKHVKEYDDEPERGAFAYSIPHTFWSVYIFLKELTWILLGFALLSVLVCCLGLLMSIRASFAAVVICGMISLEVWGLMMCLPSVQFNPFVVTTILAASGLAIEDVAHTHAAFFLEA